MTVTRGPIDRHPIGLKICAGFVNVIHTKSQMTKVATVVGQAIIAVPIVGQFNWAILLAFWRSFVPRETRIQGVPKKALCSLIIDSCESDSKAS